jgi:hypothetical protein
LLGAKKECWWARPVVRMWPAHTVATIAVDAELKYLNGGLFKH